MIRRGTHTVATALAVATALFASGCGGHGAQSAPVRPVHRSGWQLPAVPGSPSVTNFCTLFSAEISHLRALGNKPSAQALAQTLYDLAAEATNVGAAAPPQIAPAAKVYFSDMALTYRVIVDAQTHQPGPNYADLKKTVTGQNPQIADQITSFTEANCHFDPNTAPPPAPAPPG